MSRINSNKNKWETFLLEDDGRNFSSFQREIDANEKLYAK